MNDRCVLGLSWWLSILSGGDQDETRAIQSMGNFYEVDENFDP